MKKIISMICAISLMVISMQGCDNNKIIGVKELSPYIYETDTYTSIDYKYAAKYFKETYDNWGGGCSAIAKVLDDGSTIVGRNMDLNISNKCAYIVKTECKNKYKTIGLAYTFRDISPDYDYVKFNGLTSEFSRILPFMCDDVMNEEGLYIEVNMRNGETWPAGQDKFACKGTNPNSKDRVYMFEIPRILGENCATVQEAIEYVKTLDVYSKEYYWNYCFMLADKTGEYGLLEFCMNNVYWLPFQKCQTNFYINENGAEIQDTKTGVGRYENLMNGIGNVKTKDDMFNLMDTVSYFQFYDPYNCKYDARSENIGVLPGLVYDVAMDDESKGLYNVVMDEYGKTVREMTREEQRDANEYWESAFTEVADCNEKSILVRFYEDNNEKYIVSFDGIEKIKK